MMIYILALLLLIYIIFFIINSIKELKRGWKEENRKITHFHPAAFPHMLIPEYKFWEIEMHGKPAYWYKIGPFMVCFELPKD